MKIPITEQVETEERRIRMTIFFLFQTIVRVDDSKLLRHSLNWHNERHTLQSGWRANGYKLKEPFILLMIMNNSLKWKIVSIYIYNCFELSFSDFGWNSTIFRCVQHENIVKFEFVMAFLIFHIKMSVRS